MGSERVAWVDHGLGVQVRWGSLTPTCTQSLTGCLLAMGRRVRTGTAVSGQLQSTQDDAWVRGAMAVGDMDQVGLHPRPSRLAQHNG